MMRRGLKFGLIISVIFITIMFIVHGARLPSIGGDSGSWGTVLNNFLQVEHTQNGTHRNVTIGGNLVVKNETGNVTFIVNSSNGRIGIGIASPEYPLHLVKTIESSGEDYGETYGSFQDFTVNNAAEGEYFYGSRVNLNVDFASDPTYPYIYGGYRQVTVPPTNSVDLSEEYIYGDSINAIHYGSGNILGISGMEIQAVNYGGGAVDTIEGASIQAYQSGDSTANSLIGLYIQGGSSPYIGYVGNLTTAYGIKNYLYSYAYESTANITNAYGIWSSVGTDTFSGGKAHITNAYNLYLDNYDPMGSAGTIVNNYALYIENPTRGSTNFAVYSAGGNNYFGGNVGVGTTTPSAKLEVVGNVSVSGNMTIGSSTQNSNITMYSPDGTAYSCGPDNSGNFVCS